MKILRYRAGVLAVCSAVSVWQGYAALTQMLDFTVSGAAGRFGWGWLAGGPVSYFLASGIGGAFALFGHWTRSGTIRHFWGWALLVPSVWLGIGMGLFAWSEWNASFGFTTGEHLLHCTFILLPMALTIACLWSYQKVFRDTVQRDADLSVAVSDPENSLSRPSVAPSILNWLGALFAAGGSIAAVLVSGILLLLWGCEPPSIEALARRFPHDRSDLETIIEMSDQDKEMAVIDPTWLELQGARLPSSNEAVGISEARWQEYRRVFRRNGIDQGVRRYSSGGDAFIIVRSVGILDNGYSNGYLYCVPRVEHQYAPCSSTEQTGKHDQSGGEGAYEFIRLTDRWYAFRSGPG